MARPLCRGTTSDRSHVAHGLIMQELERGDFGLRSFVTVQTSLVMYPSLPWGSQEQNANRLPRLRTAEAMDCSPMNAPERRSPSAS